MRVVEAFRVGLAVAAAGIVAPHAAGAEPAQPPPSGITVTAEPATSLVDFQVIQVTGSGFEPNTEHEVFECRADAVDESGCDPENAYFADADGSGVARVNFPVDARIFDESGRETDCRAAPGTCKIGIGLLAEFENSGFVAIDFDPNAPLAPVPALTVTPATQLRDGQEVTVRATGLSSLFETFVYQCAADRPRSGTSCNFDQDVRAVADEDGRIEVTYRVDATLVPTAGGDPVDCTTRAGACVIEVALGFSARPDRIARAPLAFGTTGPPTTTSPSTTAPATTPPPPPAVPVGEEPPFTG